MGNEYPKFMDVGIKKCHKCGEEFEGYEGGIDCTMCEEWFCDSCFDCSEDHGCIAHGGGVYASMDRPLPV